MNRKDRRAGQTRGGISPFGGQPAGGSTDQMFDLAVEHHRAGRLPEAERLYREILAREPDHADSLNSFGILAHQCGRSDLALDLIGNAIAVDKRNAQYHYNVGLVFAALGRMDDAIEHNRRAVALQPDHADAHTNLAGALAARGEWTDAVLHFRRALSRKPNIPVAYSNLAGALRAEGKPEEALGVVTRGLAVEETDDLKAIFALCVQDLQSAPKIDKLRMFVERAMAECWGRPGELATMATLLVKQSDVVRVAIERAAGWPKRVPAGELFGPRGLAALSGDRLLRCLLESTPVCDVAMERLLTNARLAVLDLATGADAAAGISGDTLIVCCALAQQCFINEYVFDDNDEIERARTLRDALGGALASGAPMPPPVVVAAVACYFPLHSVPGAQALLDRPRPDAVARLIVQQVREPAEERQLRSSIPVLTTIEDSVSVLVRQQYEENPYPRWISAASLTKRLTVDEHIRARFPRASHRPLGKADVEYLVAGCGSGRHAIEAAQWFPDAKMLAIDLSLTSLSYATRKMRALGARNIEFAQADILKLDSVGRTFDVIEAIGALLHLADPAAGWRVLLSILRPGGFMRVGLYRVLAREDVRAAHTFIAERGYRRTADDIRRCRQEIMSLDDGAVAKGALNYADFFTTSECRDLLFHVREHHSTIPEIKTFLADNNLAFIGFDGALYGEYAKRHPDDPAMTNLDYWHALETENPAIFPHMYQFWLQKPAD
jgi:SAM-dependent methyltransferase/Tfp pilus assembly protein PilF